MRRLLLALCLGASIVSGAGCAQILAGGMVAGQALLITDDQEVAIGQSAANQVLADPKTPPYNNAQVNSYVQSIGMKVAAKSERPNLPYQFHVLVSSELNAFALPGGQIFITTAALQNMKNEAELSGTLAHEVTHVAHKHGIDQLRKAMIAQGLLTATLGSSPQILQQAGALALQLVLNGYGRAAESEADHYGAIYTNAAGYDPHGLVTFLQTIAAKVGDTPNALEAFSDHPLVSERVSALNSEIQQLSLTASTTDAADFTSKTQPLR